MLSFSATSIIFDCGDLRQACFALYQIITDGQCQNDSRYSQQRLAGVVLNIQNDDLAGDGDNGNGHDNFRMVGVLFGVGLGDGFQEFDADKHQHEQTKYLEKLTDFEKKNWRGENVFDYDPSQFDGCEQHNQGHHNEKRADDDSLEFLDCF